MNFTLLASVLFTSTLALAQPSQPRGGVSSEWDVRKLLEGLDLQTQHLKPIIERIKPETWVANGAPQAYVRGPFVMEGVLQGGIGALVALLALGAAFLALRARYLLPLASALNVSSIHFLPVELCVLLVAGGMAVGCAGGLFAAWDR